MTTVRTRLLEAARAKGRDGYRWKGRLKNVAKYFEPDLSPPVGLFAATRGSLAYFFEIDRGDIEWPQKLQAYKTLEEDQWPLVPELDVTASFPNIVVLVQDRPRLKVVSKAILQAEKICWIRLGLIEEFLNCDNVVFDPIYWLIKHPHTTPNQMFDYRVPLLPY